MDFCEVCQAEDADLLKIKPDDGDALSKSHLNIKDQSEYGDAIVNPTLPVIKQLESQGKFYCWKDNII